MADTDINTALSIAIVCEVCSVGFTYTPSRCAPKQRRYCSRVCADKASALRRQSQGRYTYTCRGCGVQYNARSSQYNQYCTRECYFKQKTAKATGGIHAVLHWWFKDCKSCGIRFVSSRKNTPACSEECRQTQARQESRDVYRARVLPNRGPRRCKECDSEFTPVPGKKNTKYCSDHCQCRNVRRVAKAKRRAVERGATADNIDPLQIFDRDGWRCHLCGVRTLKSMRGKHEDRSPELDHILPLACGGTHTFDNVACACRRCNLSKSAQAIGQIRLQLSC